MLASRAATPLALLFVPTCASTSYAINDPIITGPAPVPPNARAHVKAGSAVTVEGWSNAPPGTQFSVYFSGYGSYQTNSTADGKFSCNAFAPPSLQPLS